MLGILGGTFDPVHHGHLRIAMEVCQQLQLEQVRLLPLHTPPHRQAPQATPGHRLQMLHAAVAGVPELAVDDCEVRRGGISYTIETVERLRNGGTGTPVCLIMGADAFASLHTWRQWQRLPEFVHIVIVDRTGTAPPGDPVVAELLASRLVDDSRELASRPAGLVTRVQAPLLDISSSYVRDCVRQGKNIRYLVPGDVITYINAHALYQTAG